MSSMSQCCNMLHPAVGVTAGRSTVPIGQPAAWKRFYTIWPAKAAAGDIEAEHKIGGIRHLAAGRAEKRRPPSRNQNYEVMMQGVPTGSLR